MGDRMALVLNGVRRRFLSTLGQRLLDLDKMHEAIRSGAPSREALSAVRAEAHKFRGIAATIGFAALGQVAATTEDAAARALADGSLDQLCLSLDAMLDEIETIICEAADDRAGGNADDAPRQGHAR